MKRGFIIGLICFSLLLINASITVRAEETGVSSDAVISAIPQGAAEDSAEVQYFDTLTDALTYAQSNEKCTLKLLKDVSSATQIAITAGDFAFDLNGKRLSTEVAKGECISVQDASVCFKDSSSEKTGNVKGSSSAISIWGGAKVTIESGNYEASTWGIITTETPDTQVALKINGGCFRGNVGVQTSMGTNYEISGGEFYGNQNSVNNNGTMKITDGTFYGEVYNAGGAVLDFQNGTVIVSEKSSHAYAGIENKGTLNLYGGNISAAEDAEKPMNGVRNGKDAILNLYGDVNFKEVVTDFQLEEAMNICGTLKNTYRVATSVPEDGEGVVFAKVKPGGSISEATFISSETGTIVGVSADGNSLSLSKCAHQKLNHGYACKDCGLQMYASIGDKYYLSLADAFEVVKNAESAEKKTVRVLTDISADEMANLNISGGTFTLDFNGHSIADTLNVDKGNVTIVGNGGTLAGLTIQESAYAEMSGLTLKGETPILNNGTFRMTDGKVDGDQIAILNMSGTLYLDGGEILAEGIAVMNYGGTTEAGNKNGTGPAIDASVGILNSKYQLQDIDKDAELIIRGGEINADTDIYNKTGEFLFGADDSGAEGLPVAAGTVTLEGGTFVNGLLIVADEGVSLEDVLAENYWYYDSDDKKLSVDDNTVAIEKTVKVQKLVCTTHKWDSGKTTKAATCKATGVKTYTCTVCKGTKTESIAKKAHSYRAATCTKPKTCKVCSATSGSALGHKYAKYLLKATLSANGKNGKKCSVCGYVTSTTKTVYYPKTFKLSTTEYTYNGDARKPSVTVKDSKGNTLKKDTDYTVSYESGRKLPGKYTVKITFKGKYEGTKRLYFTIAPKKVSGVSASQTTTTITLKWKKVTGADGYRIYKYNSSTKKYEKLKDVTGTSYKISKLKAGTAYKYKVRAYTKDDGTIWGTYSSAFATATKPKTPSITKISSTTKGKAALTWSNVSGESGYQLYYSSKKGSGYKKVDSYKANVVKGSKSKLTSKKTYYFKVRAYKKTDSGTVYSSWSTVKSIKIK